MGLLGLKFKKTVHSTDLTETSKSSLARSRSSKTPTRNPVEDCIATTCDTKKVKTYHPLQHRWNIFQSFANQKGLSTPESGTDASIIDDWKNERDDVTLLPERKAVSVETTSKHGEEFHHSLLSCPKTMAPNVYSMRRQSSAPVSCRNTHSTPQKIWSRVSSLKACTTISVGEPSVRFSGRSKSKDDIEIQFECFLEDDGSDSDADRNYDFFVSPSPPKSVGTSSKFQPWFSKTLERVSWRSTKHLDNGKTESSRQCGTIRTEPNDDDDERQAQIIFEKIKSYEETSSRSSDESYNSACLYQENWDLEPPIQFNVPIDMRVPAHPNEYYGNRECKLATVLPTIV